MGSLVFLIKMIKYKISSEPSESKTQKNCLVMLYLRVAVVALSNIVCDLDEIISQHLFSVCTTDKFSLMKNVSLASLPRTSIHNN